MLISDKNKMVIAKTEKFARELLIGNGKSHKLLRIAHPEEIAKMLLFLIEVIKESARNESKDN